MSQNQVNVERGQYLGNNIIRGNPEAVEQKGVINPEVAEPKREERVMPPSPYEHPFDMQLNPAEFAGMRGGPAGNLMLSAARGETKQVRVEIIPREGLKAPSIFQVHIEDIHSDYNAKRVVREIPGIEVSFEPQQFTVKPGQTSSFSIIIHARNDAPDGAYLFQYYLTGDSFGGKFSSSFDLLVGNAAPPPLDNPPKERPAP
jgi:hypothetical protein